ncbi:DUF4214 domain-containing protein [Argonema galeatum]|uniref:DUF4214 domain-containing protein n=1 Tax=Argonema galeatum TaxID=2942762 RepID=UPI0020112B5F|nr:DUF4214 domain-containing protein [Argonema galeatum]MCL1465591.1 DUF4214 domain-containing protein [Argonema galeatum A003/A1]
MKLALFATAAIAIAALLIPIPLAESAKAQNCIRDGGVSVCLGDNGQRNNWDRDSRERNNGRRENRSQYDRINRLYREVLARDADFDGLRTWSRELERGRSLRDIRRELAKSREAEDIINQIYREVMGRNADSDGLEMWKRQLAKGRTLAQVRQAIERSTEARTGGQWR